MEQSPVGIENGHHQKVRNGECYSNGFSNGTQYEKTYTSFRENGASTPKHNVQPELDCSLPNWNGSRLQKNGWVDASDPVVEVDELSADVLHDLFSDNICVVCIRKYVPTVVCEKLDSFLQAKGSDPYTHEIRTDGRTDLLYFGVNRYGFPLNSTYNDESGENLERYFSEALPTLRSLRRAAKPFLSPIDKFRVELDEVWPKKVNVATLHGKKTFCGIGRIMPASLSEMSEVQPHFDAVPTTYFPDIYKQFTANVYLNVPQQGGELEIWNLKPIDVDNVENFQIPENWRAKLPGSIKIKPEQGDLLLFNTRRPHAITKFSGSNPRTSVQTFIGLTKDCEIFLWN